MVSTIIFLISNLLNKYTKYVFMDFIFKEKRVSKRAEMLIFFLYYLVSSFLFLIYSNPFLNIFSNLLLIFLITFIYKEKMLKRIAITLLIYIIGMAVENVLYSIMLNFEITALENFAPALGIISNILVLMIVIIIKKIFKSNNMQKVSAIHWVIITLIPFGSITVIIATFAHNYNPVSTLLITGFMIVINILIFYFLDVINKYYEDKYEKKLLEEQIGLYEKQLEIIKKSNENMKILKHDMKNHFSAIAQLNSQKNSNELEKYLSEIEDLITLKNEYIRTGNTMLDSLLNYKIYEAEQNGIEVKTKINIPDKFDIDFFDLNVVFSNLLNNAITAAVECEKKIVEIEIRLDRKVLYATIANSYNGILKFEDGKLVTTKEDFSNHGFGIESAENSLKKYNGILKLKYNKYFFTADLIFYCR